MCSRDAWIQQHEVPDYMKTVEPLPLGDFEFRPTSVRPILRLEEDGNLHVARASWKLVPGWIKDIAQTRYNFNARDDSIRAGKAMWRSAFKSRRCLLVATHYVEWTGPKGSKVPWKFEVEGGAPYAYAGMWEEPNEHTDGKLTCTMCTTSPNELCREYHDRMPVILHPADYALWLDPKADPKDLHALLIPFEADRMSVSLLEPDPGPPRVDSL